MTDATQGPHSSASEVTRALLALKSDKITMEVDRNGRIVASWFLANTGATEKLMQYRITLRGETGQYTSSMYELERPNSQANGELFPSYSYSFSSKDLSDPVDQILAEHGWVKPVPRLVELFRRIFRRGRKSAGWAAG